jgi:hypothetical protein
MATGPPPLTLKHTKSHAGQLLADARHQAFWLSVEQKLVPGAHRFSNPGLYEPKLQCGRHWLANKITSTSLGFFYDRERSAGKRDSPQVRDMSKGGETSWDSGLT